MKAVAAWIPSLISLCIIGCASSDVSRPARVEDDVLRLTKAYNAAWEARNIDEILQFHSHDIRYYWLGSGSVTSNTQFRRVLERILPTMRSWSMKVRDPYVKVLANDAAIVSFLSDWEAVGVDGKVTSGSGAATYVFQRRSGEWKIVMIHESEPVPGKQ